MYEIELFLTAGWKKNKLEVAVAVGLGFPDEGDKHEPDSELLTNLSILYHATPRIRPFVEFDGEKVYGGDHDGDFRVAITPGLKFVPLKNIPDLEVGAGVSLPITNDKEFHSRSILSFFYHF